MPTLRSGLNPDQLAKLSELAGALAQEEPKASLGEAAVEAPLSGPNHANEPRQSGASKGHLRNRMAPVGAPIKTEIVRGTMPELPNFVVMCCACGELFPLHDIEGTRSWRRCPLCDAQLHESFYDAAAQEVLRSEDLQVFRRALADVHALDQLQKDNRKTRFGFKRIFKALRIWWDRHRARKHLKKVQEAGLRVEQQLFALAQARYFTGRWYLDTRTGLSAQKHRGYQAYHLEPRYTSSGSFALKWQHGTSTAVGLCAEFCAFEIMRDALEGARGVLEGAALLTNLYLPLGALETIDRQKRWSQVDMVVVTTRAILVVEVKSNRRDVVVSKDGKAMNFVESQTEIGKQYDAPLRQVWTHMKDLQGLLPTIPADRFYRAVAFVGEGQVYGCNENFLDHSYVWSISHSGPRVLEALAHETANLDPFTSLSGVSAIEKQLEQYGDTLQTKRYEHVEDIASARLRASERPAGA